MLQEAVRNYFLKSCGRHRQASIVQKHDRVAKHDRMSEVSLFFKCELIISETSPLHSLSCARWNKLFVTCVDWLLGMNVMLVGG